MGKRMFQSLGGGGGEGENVPPKAACCPVKPSAPTPGEGAGEDSPFAGRGDYNGGADVPRLLGLAAGDSDMSSGTEDENIRPTKRRYPGAWGTQAAQDSEGSEMIAAIQPVSLAQGTALYALDEGLWQDEGLGRPGSPSQCPWDVMGDEPPSPSEWSRRTPPGSPVFSRLRSRRIHLPTSRARKCIASPPSASDLQDFFSGVERIERVNVDKFRARWNFDPVEEKPIQGGRWSWVPAAGGGE
eukprot:CAMPEP_0182869960 /NCGR_PEP_ID=MMETSP0034_2-20130328/10242_1 /TAXON_ID=156128 /ORGANISM="Nephroselmis pyriformis, Strain CCMP717" /LENGTH=241 /DNA_ID=CAMNT_0025002443 /DNA_START=59 /DNA_END=784 /DNA_ORIENTATION=-